MSPNAVGGCGSQRMSKAVRMEPNLEKIEQPLHATAEFSWVGYYHLPVLKVPKCENLHSTDFFYFYTIKPLWVGDFRAKIKNSTF
jgi:hypothetical protein